MGFNDSARLSEAETVSIGEGRLTITPIPNGPNRCDGPLLVRDTAGRQASAMTTLLCRCGGSRRKPYWDGSHKENGFVG